MSPVKAIAVKPVAETPKKVLKKKSVEKKPEDVVAVKSEKVAKVPKAKKESVVKSEKVAKEKKATKSVKTAEEAVAKTTKATRSKSPKAEKVVKQKKVNMKPTTSEVQGLNLSVAKVKNIIADLCINKDITAVLKDLKAAKIMQEGAESKDDFEFSLDKLSQHTLDLLDMFHKEVSELEKLGNSKAVLKEFDEETLKEYSERKKVALMDYQENKKVSNLFVNDKFDLVKFNSDFSPRFDAMETNDEWKTTLTNKELYDYCTHIVGKNKIRFNSESKIYITAFVEFIIKQLVINGTKVCVNEGKKIIKTKHSVESILPEFTMSSFVKNCVAYKKYLEALALEADKSQVQAPAQDQDQAKQESVESSREESDDDAKSVEGEESSKMPQFKYYVGELCRDVRMELSKNDPEVTDFTESKYNGTSVSKEFKQFCSDVIVELLYIFGNVLKMEVITRGVKTVNYEIVNAMIQNAHIFHSIDPTDTITFIQSTYNMYSEFLKGRHETRTLEKEKKVETEE